MPRRKVTGFTLVEMLMVVLIASVMSTVAAGQYTTYMDRIGPERAARIVGSYVALARGYAIQRRAPVSLVLDETDKKMIIRTPTELLNSVALGDETDFRLETLGMGFPGDSLTFSSRGVCRECGLTGTGTITVAGAKVGYLVTFNALGVWKMARQ